MGEANAVAEKDATTLNEYVERSLNPDASGSEAIRKLLELDGPKPDIFPVPLGMPQSLPHAVCQTMLALGPVIRTKNASQGWDYLSDTEIVAAVRNPMAAAGLWLAPHAWRLVEKEEYASKSGAQMTHYLLDVVYRLEHVSGQHRYIPMPCEASDSGDKAIAKCLTTGYKYALREIFALSSGGKDPDADDPAKAERGAKTHPPSKPASGSSGKATNTPPPPPATPEKPLDERHAACVKLIRDAKAQTTIDKCLAQAKTIAFTNAQLQSIAGEAKSRRTMLFIEEIGKADDLESVERIVQQMARYRVEGTINDTIDVIVKKRQETILAEQNAGQSDGAGDETETMVF